MAEDTSRKFRRAFADSPEPVLLNAGDWRVKIRGETIAVPFRVVADDLWRRVIASVPCDDQAAIAAHVAGYK